MCRDFYMKCTGFTRRGFLKILSFVVKYEDVNRNRHIFDRFIVKDSILWKLCGSCSSHLPVPRINFETIATSTNDGSISTEAVTAFLDEFFKRNDIDLAPDKVKVRFTKLTWLEVFSAYENNCKVLNMKYVRYDKFCSLR